MAEFVLSARAASDLDEIAAFIQLRNVDAAYRVLEAAQETCRLLAAHPELGPRRRFPRISTTIRSFPVVGYQQYVIFYRPTSDGVEIVRVLHGARDLNELFQNE